jgi:hypothetical protein
MIGQIFSRLRVVEIVSTGRKAKWLCICACGTERTIRRDALIQGTTKSCGCLVREHLKRGQERTTHGDCRQRPTPEYRAWRGMKTRCMNPKKQHYERYGGRGITVCERWISNYEFFLADMGRKPSPKHSLDRINNNGNYEPSNCRWATKKEQIANRGPQ